MRLSGIWPPPRKGDRFRLQREGFRLCHSPLEPQTNGQEVNPPQKNRVIFAYAEKTKPSAFGHPEIPSWALGISKNHAKWG